jgi:cold shock CspA family protein
MPLVATASAMLAPMRAGGTIERLFDRYGFVMGDDQRQYFFLPSALQPPAEFAALTPAIRVTFQPIAHPRGMRAMAIVVLTHAQA